MLAADLIRTVFEFIEMLFGLALCAGIIAAVLRFRRGVDLPPEELRIRRFMRPPPAEPKDPGPSRG
jgi:hypothetical protein